MGNCFANCYQNQASLSATQPNGNVSTSSSTKRASGPSSTDKKLQNRETAGVKKVTGTRRAWNRRRNRVAPCNNGNIRRNSSGKSLQSSSHFIHLVSSSSASSTGSSGNGNSDTCTTSSCSSESYQENSSRGCCSERVDSSYYDSCSNSSFSLSGESEESSKPSAKPGVTQGRLIIVQPCCSVSGSYVSSSDENIYKATTQPADLSLDASSLVSCSQNIVHFDDSSEEESCKVYPCISK